MRKKEVMNNRYKLFLRLILWSNSMLLDSKVASLKVLTQLKLSMLSGDSTDLFCNTTIRWNGCELKSEHHLVMKPKDQVPGWTENNPKQDSGSTNSSLTNFMTMSTPSCSETSCTLSWLFWRKMLSLLLLEPSPSQGSQSWFSTLNTKTWWTKFSFLLFSNIKIVGTCSHILYQEFLYFYQAQMVEWVGLSLVSLLTAAMLNKSKHWEANFIIKAVKHGSNLTILLRSSK